MTDLQIIEARKTVKNMLPNLERLEASFEANPNKKTAKKLSDFRALFNEYKCIAECRTSKEVKQDFKELENIFKKQLVNNSFSKFLGE